MKPVEFHPDAADEANDAVDYYEELADRIWVAAVRHQHRRPGYWSRRKPN